MAKLKPAAVAKYVEEASPLLTQEEFEDYIRVCAHIPADTVIAEDEWKSIRKTYLSAKKIEEFYTGIKPYHPGHLTAASAAAAAEPIQNVKLGSDIKYHNDFKKHIFDGVEAGKSHTGLHSRARVNKLTGDKQVAYANVCKLDANGCFFADATIPFGKPIKSRTAKKSSFFPDSWSEAKTIEAIHHAVHSAWIMGSEARSAGQEIQATMVGQIEIPPGVYMKIAFSGDGKTTDIVSCYPSVANKFAK
jgi:hypothetical protein